MELIEFEDADLYPVQEQPVRRVVASMPLRISSMVSTEPPAVARWRELQDYVVGQIEAIHGPFPRDGAKEAGIFKSFIGRWGYENAMAIATAAFESHGGMWHNSPVRVQRFCKGSDPYFAQPIAALLGIGG